jgi:hypothetical protein
VLAAIGVFRACIGASKWNNSLRFKEEWASPEVSFFGPTQYEEGDNMRIHLTMRRLVLLSCVMSIASWATPSTYAAYAADPLVEGAMVLTPIGALNVVATGAVEDTLKACMARIPVEASTGQRMLAERSCSSEEGTRKSIQAAPKF